MAVSFSSGNTPSKLQALSSPSHAHTHTHTHTHISLPLCLSQFPEANDKAKRFTLPLFGHLGRAVSASHVNTVHHPFTRSNTSSVTDLSISPPLSPSDLYHPPSRPLYMPQANRRQRRASLVRISSHMIITP